MTRQNLGLTDPAASTTSGITWAVSGSPYDNTRAKWIEDGGGETKTLRLFRPTGLTFIFR